jgi:hypothetical protein
MSEESKPTRRTTSTSDDDARNSASVIWNHDRTKILVDHRKPRNFSQPQSATEESQPPIAPATAPAAQSQPQTTGLSLKDLLAQVSPKDIPNNIVKIGDKRYTVRIKNRSDQQQQQQ